MRRSLVLAALAVVVFPGLAFAQAPAASSGSWVGPFGVLVAGFAMAFAAGLCALGQGRAIAAAVEAMARQPGAAAQFSIKYEDLDIARGERGAGLAGQNSLPGTLRDIIFKGQTASQSLAGQQLIGTKVIGKDGVSIGAIDDLILRGNQVEGVIVGVGGFLGVGEKKIGVQMRALKISTTDGKTTVSLPGATKEMLAAVPAYQFAGPSPSKKK